MWTASVSIVHNDEKKIRMTTIEPPKVAVIARLHPPSGEALPTSGRPPLRAPVVPGIASLIRLTPRLVLVALRARAAHT
jgi:hypothetical protein